jgi:hypothetical protein
MLQYMSACVYEPVFLVFLNTTNKHASSSTLNTVLHIYIYILYIYIYIYIYICMYVTVVALTLVPQRTRTWHRNTWEMRV